MTLDLDQVLEPGERVLKRANRFGTKQSPYCMGWIALGVVTVFSSVVWGHNYGLWQLDRFHILLGFWLIMVASAILYFLDKILGIWSYTVEAIVTTDRILVGAKGGGSSIEELRLVDVAGVKFYPGVLDYDEYTTVSGQNGEKFNLKQQRNTRQLVVTLADAAKLPHSILPGVIKNRFIKIYNIIRLSIVLFCITLLYFVLTYEVIHFMIYDQPYFLSDLNYRT